MKEDSGASLAWAPNLITG